MLASSFASSYSIGLTLGAVGFYYYVLFPVWVWFAYTSIRMPSTGALRVTSRHLMVSVVLWISFTIPLFLFSGCSATSRMLLMFLQLCPNEPRQPEFLQHGVVRVRREGPHAPVRVQEVAEGRDRAKRD